MTPGERVLLALSRPPQSPDYGSTCGEGTVGSALDPLRSRFPGLHGMVAGKRVLDFGCGTGRQAVALAREGAELVLGVDINPRWLEKAATLARMEGIPPGRLAFAGSLPEEQRGAFDLVISKDSMEHFADPELVLREMKRALHPEGRLLVTFGPPWLAPYGSHMHFFTRVPWVNLLFREETVMRVRSRFRDDGATRYEEVESGLNRMTVSRFERIAAGSGMRVEHRSYECVKGLDLLGRVPGIRELFVNHVNCILAPRACSASGDPSGGPR